MTGRIWRRLAVVGLAAMTAVTGIVPGTTLEAQALTVADRIQTINTSTAPWTPNAPGPSGIAYRPETNTLIVVDGDKNAELSTINLWEYSLDTKSVVYSASLEVGDPLDDATGAAWDSANQVLYVSTDGDPAGIYLFEPNGVDGPFGGADDGFIDVGTLIAPLLPLDADVDVEDPAFDADSGRLFVLNGNSSHVFELDPAGDGFGNGNDTLVGVGFVVPPDTNDPPDEHPDDWEGLAFDPDTGNLLVGAKETDEDHSIYEVTTAGVFVDRIDVTVIENELGDLPPLIISGLTVQPAAGGELTTYWIADRGDHTPPIINDGRLHRIHREAVVVPDVDPVLDPIGNKSGNEGTQIKFQATATDSFDDTLTFTLDAGGPTNDNITSSGLYTWTPTEAQGGASPQTVTVRVTDGLNNPDFETITITANEVNQVPVVTPNPDILLAEGEPAPLQMFEADADLPTQTITWDATGLPSGLSINPSTGLISGTIGVGTTADSPYDVTVSANDGVGTGQDVFELSVTDTNRSPVLTAIGNKTVTQGSTLMFKANATDPDGDGFTFSLVSPPAGASISSAGNFTWTPSVAPGDYPVTVKVTDNGTPVLTDQETITISVQASNPNPTPSPDPDNPFVDDDGHIFENAIEWLAGKGITEGCNPPLNDRFCPDEPVTRGQMAVFLVRAFGYSDNGGGDLFVDDDSLFYENSADRLFMAGVTLGCNPPTNNRYCGENRVTRGQMAAFLGRAFEYTDNGGGDWFIDDDASVFENAIDRLRTAGVTQGCNPPANDRYCPEDFVTRGQMATFLKRAFGE